MFFRKIFRQAILLITLVVFFYGLPNGKVYADACATYGYVSCANAGLCCRNITVAGGQSADCYVCGNSQACEVYRDCPAGTTPNWTAPLSQGCGHWGKVCGNGVRRGGTAVCCGGNLGRCKDVKQSSVQYANCIPNTPPTPTPTPIQYGTLRARAWTIATSDTTCNAVYTASPAAALSGTVFTINPAGSAKTQVGSPYVSWTTIPVGTYTLQPTPPVNYVIQAACWGRTVTAPTAGTGLSSSFAASGETLSWDLGYTLGTPWTQVVGGDVYAASALVSYIPASSLFLPAGSGGYPGVATYGTSYDFDSSGATQGSTRVSPTNWLAQDTMPHVDYYQLFYQRFGGKPTTVDYISPAAPIPQPISRSTPYYVSGDMTTSGDWLVPAGESLIFFVDGNLTIGGNVNVTGSGFVAFIVSGSITVDSEVGVPYTSTSPVVEGIYIARGTIETGESTMPGHERFVGKGIFVSGGDFVLQRDLDTISHNQDTSAELFIYNPQFLVTMPEAMKETDVTWKEVAP